MNWPVIFSIGVHAVAIWLLYLGAQRFILCGRQLAMMLEYQDPDSSRGIDPKSAALFRQMADESIFMGSINLLLAFAGVVLVEVIL